MANFSYSMSRGIAIDKLGQSGSQSVTTGTLAPNAGDIEVRISDTNGITKREVKELLDNIFRYLDNSNNSPSTTLL